MFYSTPAPLTVPRSQARALSVRLMAEAVLLEDTDQSLMLPSRLTAGFRRKAATLRRRSHEKLLDSLDRPEGVA
ncbi:MULTISPECIES: hypothetical protein [Gluconobacter]|uniref:Uncharacterized protein n=5 Tax=Gluconobacter TaxID=441 RepID=A0A829X0V9_GLUOY|nr:MULTISPECIES: hypothetical protein [Gluconobacter]OAG71946.1 hypothetical protein A0J51_02954 [Gluconobacter japonicus]MBF0856563.1 hypothetical protein [Gluconobacter oxydans]MBS0984374.1 hypothetical protein [Gluconobacter cerinus]MBS1032502.1 hypothetical protein [Gluconobacter cerinus]MBS1035688.1 hypothetical protein [Gluconobacter cerinus]